MNSKVIAAVLVVAVVAAPLGYFAWVLYGPCDIADVYDDCYLELQDADSLSLKGTEHHNSKSLAKTNRMILGSNIESTYGGYTLYKTVGGEESEVQMYSLPEDADTTDGGAVDDRIYRVIDRDIKSIYKVREDVDNWLIVEFYGVESDTDSYRCMMEGYDYDPNSQLTYLVDEESGKMYNITKLHRAIIGMGGFDVYDAHYDVTYEIYLDQKWYISNLDNRSGDTALYELEFIDDEISFHKADCEVDLTTYDWDNHRHGSVMEYLGLTA